MARPLKQIIAEVDWIGSSKKDLLSFPRPVIKEIGLALGIAQHGGKSPSTKPLRGLGTGILEVVEIHRGDAYRAAYTVRFDDRIYVLHCFQKKSKSGIKTPKADIDLIKGRLKVAQADYDKRHGGK